ncbi:MAG TPA: CBS domain-containing protein [Candidatus Limnocylindrales bacterium]|jgi:signal-transduction protein with cAMP-binding, CBS, and nucleotidyltransferase domain|nr:CBS domain-containing protein [Candidatus Limnocylindrales bacterium]
MRCPQCGFENLIGSDICDNCGADLAGRDTPEPAISYRGPLLGEHLDDLEIGTPEIIDVSADADEAIQRMHEDGTDCVLVVDDGRLVGIFTDRDAVLKVAGRPRAGRPIAELMTHDPVVLRHDDTVAVAINKMAVGGFRHIPIVEGGRPIGLVSARDVFRHLASTLG